MEAFQEFNEGDDRWIRRQQPIELGGVDDCDRPFSPHGDVLRPLVMGAPDDFAESRLRLFQPPRGVRRRLRMCLAAGFSRRALIALRMMLARRGWRLPPWEAQIEALPAVFGSLKHGPDYLVRQYAILAQTASAISASSAVSPSLGRGFTPPGRQPLAPIPISRPDPASS